MKTRTYQLALASAIGVCVLLIAALVFVLMGGHLPAMKTAAPEDVVVARGGNKDPGPRAQGNAAQQEGEPALTPIQLSPQRLQEIGVTTALVERKNINDTLHAPGDVEIDEQKLTSVQTRFSGWIQNVSANATYKYVRKGQRLFTIYSPDIVSSEQEYLLAKRNQKTFSQDVHGMATEESGWLLQAAEEHLRQFDIPAQEIADLEQSGKVQREIAINSPVSGYITERNALPNTYVQPEMKLYTIADLSTIWVYANVSQSDVGRLKPGDPGEVTVDAYPGRKFNGRVDQVLPQVDQATRTVRVRLVLGNPGVALKPGMYVNVDIGLPLGKQLVAPASAVLETGSRAITFVDRGEGNLEPRVVEIGPQVGESVVILKGLTAGERVVSSANFLVDSEAQLQASFGTGTAASQQPAATPASAQVGIEFETSSLRKGTNTVRVKLTGADQKPAAGMQVAVSFFIAAMPAMGMAGEHAQTTLSDKGAGQYEGAVQLDAGGTWAVTVDVEQGGRTVATKKFSVSAGGGM